jgi:hypothetical protein
LSPDSVVRGKEKRLSAWVCVGLRMNRFFGFIRQYKDGVSRGRTQTSADGGFFPSVWSQVRICARAA